MFPWLWFWSPHFYFPFSGSVAQRIEPDTDWFFAGIAPQAGNAEMERRIFDIASYGRQLGWITEVLLGMHSDDAKVQAQAAQSLQRLREAQVQIEAVKKDEHAALTNAAATALEQLRAANPGAYERLLINAPRAARAGRRISSKSSAS
ncbi:MAG TPA: hypothetical protein VEP93_06990 [Variovorax sp.]|nr:hypothetical protein [Variovorax sp.]